MLGTIRRTFIIACLAPVLRSAEVRVACVNLHAGAAEILAEAGTDCGVRFVNNPGGDFTGFDVVLLQHIRREDSASMSESLRRLKTANPKFRVFSCSNNPGAALPELARDGILEDQPGIWKYYSGKTNLKRLPLYLAVTFFGQAGSPLPPVDDIPALFHPECQDIPDLQTFFRRRSAQIPGYTNRARALVTAHAMHLSVQQPETIAAIVRECERQNFASICLVDGSPDWRKIEKDFRPDIVIHTCHAFEDVPMREELDVPHISSVYTKNGLDDPIMSSERQHQIVSQEVLGTTQPMLTSADTERTGLIQPDPERVSHLVARAAAMVRLRTRPAAEKKVAVVYYDRSMGKSELMRGTATGMFLNAPRSLLRVLQRFCELGYKLTNPPVSEEDLLARMMDHGRQVGIWAPNVLGQLAESGKAVLIPAETYKVWFETKVPQAQRERLIREWGPPPGRFMVYEKNKQSFIVVPRVDLGNVVLLPQPLRGEAHTVSALGTQTHDILTPPPHNYLATYFWIQETFKADAMIHFGTHGSEFLLPGKPDALSRSDWPDMIFGSVPNISLWIISNTGESTPVRRRGYATIIDHLTPPLETAGLSDELLNLRTDIEKWRTAEEGPLKEAFFGSITNAAAKANLSSRPITPETVGEIERTLEETASESIPTSLHILGQIPPEEKLLLHLVRCAGASFMTEWRASLPQPCTPERASETAARRLEELLKNPSGGLPDGSKRITDGFKLMLELHAAYQKTGQEIDNIFAALNGRFIPPGPANSPDRNPGSVPTGRNMFTANPEEIPAPQSWEMGVRLAQELLAAQKAKTGKWPNKVAFSLSPFSSFRDYGVIESQILYLMGVRPVWDSKRQVKEVELIPAADLGRPRIDVFLSARGYYRDQMPTRMQLIDRAVRLVAECDEPDNQVRQNVLRVRQELMAGGMAEERAKRLAGARMFGPPPGQSGSGWYYYLAEKSGEWNSREDLMKTYLEQMQYVYTESIWGENATETYERVIQGTEIVVRSWADSTSSPLSNKYMWFVDGSLAQAVHHLTGKTPEYYLADVRDVSKTRMVTAEEAIQTDFRARLFNRKWIEGMMKEGYAGADQMSVHVSNMFGWEALREGSIRSENWNETVDVYLRDSKKLGIRKWFDETNPYAFQGLTQTLLESARKGYWKPSPETLREIAGAYAESVAKHGSNGGLRGGGNKAFAAYLKQIQTGARPVKGKRLERVHDWRPAFAAAAAGLLVIYGFIRKKGTL